MPSRYATSQAEHKSSVDREQAGVNGFLDVARQTYKEANQDAYDLVEGLNGTGTEC